MTVNEIWVIKMVFGSFFLFFMVAASFFGLYNTCKGDDQGSVNTWFRSKWKRLEKSPFLTLPEKSIGWVLNIVKIYNELPLRDLDFPWLRYCLNSSLIFVVIVSLYSAHWNNKVFCTTIFIIILLFCISSTFVHFYKKPTSQCKVNNNIVLIFEFLTMLSFCLLMCLAIYIVFSFSLKISLLYSLPVMLAITPSCMMYSYIILDQIVQFANQFGISSVRSRDLNESIAPFIFAGCISFSVTYSSFLFGNVANPEALVPQTFSMLLSNVLFDGLTMVTTLAILRWAIARKVAFRIPLAIGIDIFLCAVLACGSLYFGLYLSDYRLSMGEVVLVLFGRVPDNAGFELGPCFWAMHTTFLPTMFYLSFILFAWVSQCFLYPVRWLFGVGQTHKNPLKLTAVFLYFISAIFFALTYGTGLAEEYVKGKHLRSSAPDKQIRQPLYK